MSTIAENTSFMCNTITNIQEQLENLILSINNINNECNNNESLYDVICKAYERKSDDKEISIIRNYIKSYKETGNIFSFIQFLICFYNNPSTSYEEDDKIRNYLYCKIFNINEKKESI